MTQKAPYLALHIANYFLWKAREEGVKDMTQLKLMKLVYFAYAWNLAIFEKEIFSEIIEAWKHGPVVPSIYHEFKRFQNSPITDYAELPFEDSLETYYPMVNSDDDNTIRVLETVWDVYKNKSGWDLRQITHEDAGAWQGENIPIERDRIIERATKAILDNRGKSV